MKNIISALIAGLIGGMIAIVAFKPDAQLIDNAPKKEKVYQVGFVEDNPPVVGPSFVDAAKRATGAVVHIYAEKTPEYDRQRYPQRRGSFFEQFFGDDFFNDSYYRRQNGSGSGVIYSKDGYIVTNNHVVGFADKITVTLENGKKYNAKKIGTDPLSDLAVIKIEADGLKTMKVANSDKLEVGEWVLAVGNPFDYLTSTVTAGIVSAKGRDLDMIKGEKAIEEFIQTDAAINPGNSGGALVTQDGELVGINTAIATPTGVFAGYSFAIPSNLMKSIVDEIMKTGGDKVRPNLGVGGYDVTNDVKEEFGLKVDRGFYVADVDNRGSAKLAGILPGDVIIAINNKDVDNFDEINDILKYQKAGESIDITVSRFGKKMDIPTYLRQGL